MSVTYMKVAIPIGDEADNFAYAIAEAEDFSIVEHEKENIAVFSKTYNGDIETTIISERIKVVKDYLSSFVSLASYIVVCDDYVLADTIISKHYSEYYSERMVDNIKNCFTTRIQDNFEEDEVGENIVAAAKKDKVSYFISNIFQMAMEQGDRDAKIIINNDNVSIGLKNVGSIDCCLEDKKIDYYMNFHDKGCLSKEEWDAMNELINYVNKNEDIIISLLQ